MEELMYMSDLVIKKPEELKTRIFIPSRDRAKKQLTFKALKEAGLEKITQIVVQPQYVKQYEDEGYPVLSLDIDNCSLIHSRNFILDYCRQNNIDYCVQMDDDISRFLRKKIDNTHFVGDSTAVLDYLTLFEQKKEFMTMEYRHVGWNQQEYIGEGRGMEMILGMYIPEIPKGCKFEEGTKEDKDFSIQLLLAGKHIYRTFFVCMESTEVGSEGGLCEHYASGKNEIFVENMYNKWGNKIIKLKKKYRKDGSFYMTDAMINWKYLRELRDKKSQNNKSLFDDF